MPQSARLTAQDSRPRRPTSALGLVRAWLAGAVAIVAVATPLLLAPSVPASTAGAPGVWTRVTDPNGRNTDEVGIARTNDGVLHVVWKRRQGSLNEGVMHTPVMPSGKVGSASTVVAGLKSVGNPALVRLADGRLRAFFPGLGDTNDDGGMKAATAPASGTGWKREGVRVSSSTSALSPGGAAVTKGGDTVFAYSRSSVLAFHAGLDPAQNDKEIQPDKRCCDYLPGLATDAQSGRTMIAWYSNATGRKGIWVQQILPSTGPRQLAPGSLDKGNIVGIDQVTPITARIGAPGVYVAYCAGYPSCKRALLWRVGGGAPVVAGTGEDVEDVNIAAAPEGRIWVMWQDARSDTLFATRSNKAATRFGPVTRVRPPAGTSAIWKVKGEGSRGPLDLLASVTTGSSLATWHTQVWPPLAINAQRKGKTVTFRVTDVGDPVPGAKISFAGKTLTTNAKGQATAGAPKTAAKATASKAAYTSASITVPGQS